MPVRSGIVTTLINAEKILVSFVKYHLSIGFDRIYLFFDNPKDESIDLVKDFPNVCIILTDDNLKKKWQSTKLYNFKPEFHSYIEKEAMSRQMLNMSVACELALNDNIDWLLHIDIDELFYLPNQSVSDHFTQLTRYKIPFMQYFNYEGIPPKFDIDDFFKEVTLFKVNTNHYSFFQKYFKKQYHSTFHYYDIGKTAAQVNKIEIPFLHEVTIKPEKRQLKTVAFQYFTRLRILYKKLTNLRSIKLPVILHYPICGYKHFESKYKTLGNFEDKWFGVRDILPFHKKSRDIFNSGDSEAAKIFFKKNVMVAEDHEINSLKAGTFIKIENPAKLVIHSQDK